MRSWRRPYLPPNCDNMVGRWLIYLAALLGCLIFEIAYQGWISWVALIFVLFLPILSFLLSLPGMLTARVTVDCRSFGKIGEDISWTFTGKSRFLFAFIEGRLAVRNELNGEKTVLKKTGKIPTAHCGALTLTPHRMWVYDYLGLFRLPVRKREAGKIWIMPTPVIPEKKPVLRRRPVMRWIPKNGGGFSENHDLRLYRPGDNLRQIHWKLTAKTGKLIYREPIEAQQEKAVLSVCLWGAPEALDEKLGMLLWTSRYFIRKEFVHNIRCTTGKGVSEYSIEKPEDVQAALLCLLEGPKTEEPILPNTADAGWHYEIGGDGDEA